MALMALDRRNRIKDILEDRQMSIYSLAKRVNEIKPEDMTDITYNTIWRITSSKSIPPRTDYINVLLIANALGVTVNALEEAA